MDNLKKIVDEIKPFYSWSILICLVNPILDNNNLLEKTWQKQVKWKTAPKYSVNKSKDTCGQETCKLVENTPNTDSGDWVRTGQLVVNRRTKMLMERRQENDSLYAQIQSIIEYTKDSLNNYN